MEAAAGSSGLLIAIGEDMSTTDALPREDSRFRTTRWSLVQAAGDLEHRDSHQALSELCQSYWLPVYSYFRRRVGNPVDAQDLTQEFFAKLLDKNYIGDARQEKGRFRTFLLTAAQRFLSKEWAKANAKKRGGDKTVLSLDFDAGESFYAMEPADTETPEKLFDRQWAVKLLEVVHERLRQEYDAADKHALYDELKPLLVGAGPSQREVANRLGMTEGAVKTAVYRMRTRYSQLLRCEIAETVDDPDEVDDEVAQLFEALA